MFVISFIISTLFPHLNLFVSIFIKSYVNNSNLHVSTLYIYQLSTRQETPKRLKSYTYSLRLHLMRLIPIISFKLGHVSIFLKDVPYRLSSCFVHTCTIAQFSRILRFSFIYCYLFNQCLSPLTL